MTVIKDTGQRALPPPFTEEHEELRQSLRRFVRAEIAPHVEEWEEAREFPRELFTRCGELGFLGLKYPEALGAVGAMQRLLEVAIDYAKEREAFGRPIGRFQAIRHKIAEISIKAEVAKALTYNALRLFHDGIDVVKEVTQAKLYSQRACVEVADEVIQIHGGYGYMREYGVERAYRDARLGPIGGGTDEIMREILGKQLGL